MSHGDLHAVVFTAAVSDRAGVHRDAGSAVRMEAEARFTLAVIRPWSVDTALLAAAVMDLALVDIWPPLIGGEPLRPQITRVAVGAVEAGCGECGSCPETPAEEPQAGEESHVTGEEDELQAMSFPLHSSVLEFFSFFLMLGCQEVSGSLPPSLLLCPVCGDHRRDWGGDITVPGNDDTRRGGGGGGGR